MRAPLFLGSKAVARRLGFGATNAFPARRREFEDQRGAKFENSSELFGAAEQFDGSRPERIYPSGWWLLPIAVLAFCFWTCLALLALNFWA